MKQTANGLFGIMEPPVLLQEIGQSSNPTVVSGGDNLDLGVARVKGYSIVWFKKKMKQTENYGITC